MSISKVTSNSFLLVFMCFIMNDILEGFVFIEKDCTQVNVGIFRNVSLGAAR